MAKKTTGFNIKEVELAAALEITGQELDQIIRFFDSDPKDEWELRENDHYIYINKSLGERLFSEQGAYAIAAYMDATAKKSLLQKLFEFITRHKAKIRNAFISRKIQENSSSLTFRNSRHFLSKKDVTAILATSPAKLNQAFNDIQRSSRTLEIYEDFEDFDGIRYYSLLGLYELSKHLSKELKSKDRREWCGAIEVVGKKTFPLIIDAQTSHEKKIQSAMQSAKTRDKGRCQITNQKPDKHNKFNVTVHHIYSQKDYPQLAACRENLITLAQDVHNEFHNWNGGSQKPCTADDLICFVNQLYSDNYEVVLKLNQVKKMFESTENEKAAQSDPKKLPRQGKS
jgi:hypothetical protein